MPFNMGGPEMLIVLAVVLIVFGAGKLPNVMGDVGRGLREFRKAQTEPDPAPDAPARTTAGAITGVEPGTERSARA